jgi:sugar O-acyltransferase (sialic acid O-acetyltransferase NeuD family)
MPGRGGGDVVLVGSGGFGRETAQAIHALNAAGASWRLLGFLDDDPQRKGLIIEGTPVLGGRECLAELPEAAVVVCTGRPSNYVSRLRIVAELELPPERYATIVHPSAATSATSSIGPGSVLLAQVTLTTAVTIGAHVAIMPHVTLTHDDVIEDFATIASGVSIGGGTRIRTGAYLGAGALVGAELTVGAFSLVGMGAVVTREVPAREVWAGVPARYFRAADIPAGIPAGIEVAEAS